MTKLIFRLKNTHCSQFYNECNVPEPKSKTCKKGHLDTIFVSTNFEADKKAETSKANCDLALCRFEWLEAIMRVAKAKFCDPKVSPDIRAAVDKLWIGHITPRLPPEAILDRDDFRRERLYTREVRTSVAVIAETPLSSPRKLYIFIIKKYFNRNKVSKKKNVIF